MYFIFGIVAQGRAVGFISRWLDKWKVGVQFPTMPPFYWLVVKWPNTAGFDPAIRRFKSCRACHLALKSSPAYEQWWLLVWNIHNAAENCGVLQGAVDWSPLGRFFFKALWLIPKALWLRYGLSLFRPISKGDYYFAYHQRWMAFKGFAAPAWQSCVF